MSPIPHKVRLGLSKAGLPRSYINRVVAELADHLEDISHCGRSADAIGEVDSLVKSITDEYREASLAGRHPLLTIVLAGMVQVPLFWSSYFFVIFFASEITEPTSFLIANASSWQSVANIGYLSSYIVPFALSAWIGVRIVTECGRGWLLVGLTIALQCYLATASASSFEFSQHDRQLELFVGMGIGGETTHASLTSKFWLERLVHLAVTGATGLAALYFYNLRDDPTFPSLDDGQA